MPSFVSWTCDLKHAFLLIWSFVQCKCWLLTNHLRHNNTNYLLVEFPRWISLFVLLSFVLITNANDDVEDPEKLGCHKRKYNFRVTQTDKNGRSCWDLVSVRSCFGRCDSKEISDYKFPFKRSFHPVCVFSGRIPSVATLRNCDPGVEEEAMRYHYMEATSCKCQTCSTVDTSCEAPKEIHHPYGSKIMDLFGSSGGSGGVSRSAVGVGAASNVIGVASEEYNEY